MARDLDIHAPDDPRVDELIAAYLDAVDAGSAPPRHEWLAQHPELADELRDCLDAMDHVEKVSQPLRSSASIAGPQTANAPRSALDEHEPSQTPGAGDATTRRFGDYQLLDEIARGGMGVVFRARQLSLDRIVALKMILAGQLACPDDVQRFQAEAQAAAGLQHPNIVAIHEVGEHAGQHYFSMDLIDGVSLAEYARAHPMSARDAARLLQTIAEAVQYAHERGILHRDLKPSNVLLQNSGGRNDARITTLVPKVTDFGLAKRIAGGSDLTGTGQILGTPGYMPPEQAMARHAEIGPASDVYALGAILYELLTGRPPFRAESPMDTLVQVLETDPIRPRILNRGVPRDLETVCLKCLEKDTRRRYGSAQELANDLERFVHGEPILARAVSRPERLWRWCARHPAPAALIATSALALLLIAAGSAWFTQRLRQELAQTDAKQRELQIALARQVAERLDSDLRQLAGIPSALARLLSDRPDWTLEQIDETLRHAVASDPRLFGCCVAFEPFQFDSEHEDFARYAYRATQSPDAADAAAFQIKFLHPPSYRPYRDWDWYRLAKTDGRPHWTEPYIDIGGGNVPMVTFSAPIERGGQFVGVVTADLSLEYFRQLKRWLDELQVGRGDYGFVISPAGTFISDANPDYQMGRRIDEFARPSLDLGYTTLLDLIRRGQPGRVNGVDFWTDNPVTFLVAPVPSSGWSFVAVIPEQKFVK
jgi:hypothetical protein